MLSVGDRIIHTSWLTGKERTRRGIVEQTYRVKQDGQTRFVVRYAVRWDHSELLESGYREKDLVRE